MNEPAYVAETLAWCNAYRAENGKKPLRKLPKGYRGNPSSCPCGKATGLMVIVATAWPPNDRPAINTSPAVREFIHAFDTGLLPQYEAAS